MSDCNEPPVTCKEMFADLKKQITDLDKAIRGNGKPGLLVRIDRLEEARRLKDKIFYLLCGTIGTVLLNVVVTWIKEAA